MLIDIEDAHIFWMSIFGKVSNVAVAEATDARRPTMSPYLGGMAASKHPLDLTAILGR